MAKNLPSQRLSSTQTDEVKRLRTKGYSLEYIARVFGVGRHQVTVALNPDWSERCKERMRRSRKSKARRRPETAPVEFTVEQRPTPQELAARRREIPADTRDLTGRLFGDPLPGRSALDQQHIGAV